MIGRAAELDRLTQLMATGANRTPAVALIAGEAGVGKTRLVRELLDRVPSAVPVLAGQAEPGALGRPFELLLDALDSSPHADDDRAAITERHRARSRSGSTRAGADPGPTGRRSERSSSSRTSTGPTRRASACSSGWPSPTAGRWC